MAEASASPVVGITTHGMAPNHFQPWATGQSFSVGGSGCIISGKRILTNAHVVTYQTVVMVRREGEPDPVPARVVAVAHDADLAVLTVDDPAFFEGVEPLEFAGIPSIQSEVTVLGYPAGGDALCATSGVISRVERTGHNCAFLMAAVNNLAVINDTFGYDIPTGAQRSRRTPCSACGLSKRHLFDAALHVVVLFPPKVLVVQRIVGIENLQIFRQGLGCEIQGVDVGVRRRYFAVVGPAVNNWYHVEPEYVEKLFGYIFFTN